MSEMAKIKRKPATEKIAKAILEEYEVSTAEDVQSALKDILAPVFEIIRLQRREKS